MSKRVKYYEKLREKRRLARERARKVNEERKRAREMKEEKWTTRAEFGLVSDHRKLQREEYIAKIRSESKAMLDMAVARVKSHKEKEELIKKETEKEVETVGAFIEEQCIYYDEIHKQISPPKERSVIEIVSEIEKELREIYDKFADVFYFNPEMPFMENGNKNEDHIFAKEIAQLEKEFEENTIKAETLEKEISKARIQIETENVKFAAIEQHKSMEILKLEKQIKKMETKLEFIKQDPVEVEEIGRLEKRVEEEASRNKEYDESLKYIKEMIRIKKAEKMAGKVAMETNR